MERPAILSQFSRKFANETLRVDIARHNVTKHILIVGDRVWRQAMAQIGKFQ